MKPYMPMLLVLGTALTGLEADTIYLRNGRKVECAINGQTRRTVRCRTAAGKNLKFSKRRIRRVSYGTVRRDPAAEARLASRKRAEARRLRDARRARERRELERRAAEAMRKQSEAKKIAVAGRLDRDKVRRRKIARGGETSSGGALWRSLLLPGWGQAARGDTWRGVLLGGGFLLAAGSAATFRARHAGAKAVYDESARNAFLLGQSDANTGLLLGESNVASDQAAMTRAAVGFQAAAGLAAVIYLYNIFDAYFFTRELPRSTRLASDGKADMSRRSGLNFFLGSASLRDGQSPFAAADSPAADDGIGFSYTIRF